MKRLMLILLAALLCCSMLLTVACNDAPEQPEDPSDNADDSSDPSEPVTPPPSAGDLLNEDGTCRYVVMRSDLEGSGHPVTTASVAIRNALAEVLGVKVDIKTDWEKDPDAEEIASRYEILVGNTNRPESKQVIDSLEEYSYAIRVVGNKIVIAGANNKATVMAAQLFIDEYLKGDGEITATLDVVRSYTPLPTDITIEDKSNGKTGVFLIETKYETEDVVIADIHTVEQGYAVDPTGMADSTAGIQKALNDCARAGGGTVWLPAGTYVISSTITIPPFVTLRGDWQDPDQGTEYGTIISVWNESSDVDTTGIFMLGGSGGVLGLTVFYPHQSLDAVQPYPFTFYTNGSGANYMLSTVKNVTVINGYRGIGACCTESGAHEQLTVENFKGTFLYCGTEVYNQADVGTWQDVTISPKYWQQALESVTIASLSQVNAPEAAAVADYVKANAVGLKLGDLEWTEFESLKVDGYKIGIEIVDGKRIQFAGSLYDTQILNCGQGLLVNDLDPRWGMVIANSVIENGIHNKTQGLVKLCGVKVTGDIKGEVWTDDVDEDLSYLTVDYKASYKKPVAKVYVADVKEQGDMTAAIQAALDEAAATGGVVYIPAGLYRVEGRLTVPAGVELRGASSVATRDQGGMAEGTLLQCYYGHESASPTDPAFITLAGDYAGINGIRIVYPENGPYDSNLNTTYTVRGNGKGVYMVNSMIAAASHGVDFRGCDEHFIKKVTTCCYYNTFAVGGKGGILTGCLQNGTVLTRTASANLVNWLNESNIWADLFDPITRKDNVYIRVEGAEDQLIYNTFIYGCSNMILNQDSVNTLAVNIGSDNIGNKSAQIVCRSGSLAVVNSMRYNGVSYEYEEGTLELYNRITINDKNEKILIK